MNFHTYGTLQLISLRDLLTRSNIPEVRGNIFARAEFSGSEGCYVEVARWNNNAGAWQKFAFMKILDGDYEKIWRGLSDREMAERLADLITKRHANTRTAFIHSLPTFEEVKR